MKIAFLVNYFPKLSETFVMNQIVGLLDRGHDVQIFAVGGADEELRHSKFSDYNLQDRTVYFESPDSYSAGVITMMRLALNQPTLIPEIGRSITRGVEGGIRISTLSKFARNRTQKFDVYHAHFGQVGKRWDFIPNQTGAPFITSFYGHDASRDLSANPWSHRHLFQVADKVTVLSEDMREDLISGGCPEEKTRIQPLPVDLSNFKSTPPSEPNDGPIQILSISRLVEKKGIDDALSAVHRVSQQYDVRWKIAGNGPLREKLETRIHDCGLEETVEFLGWVTQGRVQMLLDEADIFLLPSKTSAAGDKEGTPTVLLEAQASSVPVISTYHAGIPEIVRDGETGLLVPENDPEALTEALEYLLANPEEWSEMGRQGRTFVKNRHSVPRVAKQLEQLYQGVIR